MPAKCRPDVAAIRAQTERMLDEAEKKIGTMPSVHALSGPRKPGEFAPATKQRAPRSAEHCTRRLESARAVYAAAGEQSDLMAQRDGYIRAAFQAGQALSCAQVQVVGKKLGVTPPPKPKKPRKPRKK